jgi:hypothetical protein
MHGAEIKQEALRLVAAGVNDCEIARRLGVLGLCVEACRLAGLDCRPTARYVRINRRASVARLLEHVPRKR